MAGKQNVFFSHIEVGALELWHVMKLKNGYDKQRQSGKKWSERGYGSESIGQWDGDPQWMAPGNKAYTKELVNYVRTLLVT